MMKLNYKNLLFIKATIHLETALFLLFYKNLKFLKVCLVLLCEEKKTRINISHRKHYFINFISKLQILSIFFNFSTIKDFFNKY